MNSANPIPSRIQFLARQWLEAKRAALAHNALFAKLHREYQEETGCESYCNVFKTEALASLGEVKESIRHVVIDQARRNMSPAGALIDIDLSDLEKECSAYGAGGFTKRIDFDDAVVEDSFNPIALWLHLEGKFGGGKAFDETYSRVARKLKDLFHLSAGSEVKMVGGRTVLTLGYIYWEEQYRGGWSYNSQERLGEALDNLFAAARWADLVDHYATSCRWTAQRELRDRRESPRGLRYSLGDHIELLAFKSKFEFRLSPELSGKLKAFIGVYAPAALDEAA